MLFGDKFWLPPTQGSGRGEDLSCLKQRFDSRKDHGPAAIELIVGPLVQLIVRHFEQT